MRALLLVAGGLALAGCAPSTQDQVRDAVHEYVRAYADGDAKTVCARLTPELIEAFKEGCEAGIAREAAGLSAEDRAKLREQEVRAVSVKGDTAKVRLNTGAGGSLRRVDGRWLIENR